MKHIFSLLPFFLLFLCSCEQETYDTGNSSYSRMTAEFADAHVRDDKLVDYVLTDDGDSLIMERPFGIGWIEKADTTYRMLLYYGREDNKIEAMAAAPVLVTPPMERDRFKKGIISDPVIMRSLWMSKNGKYINLHLQVMTGRSGEEKENVQVFGCVRDTLLTAEDGSQVQGLCLHHEQNGQPEYYSREVFLSISMKSIQTDRVVIRLNTYDGWREKTFSIVR